MSVLNSALTKSLLVHAAIVGMLVVSVDFPSHKKAPQPTPQMQVIKATAISQQAVEERLDKIRDAKAAVQRAEQQKREEQRRRAEAEQRRRLEAKREAEEKARKIKAQKEAEEQRQKALQKQRADTERQRREEEQARRQREKEEAERQKRLQEQREKDRQLQEQRAAEQAARQRQQMQRVATEVEKYTALIRQTIQRFLIVDKSMKGKSCRLNIRLAPNGLLLKVTELGGDDVVCRAAQNAVYKTDTYPMPEDDAVRRQLQDINLTVEPEL